MSHGSRRILTLFLDANIIISAAWKEGTEISHVWSFEGIQLLTSSYVMGEVQRNLPAIDQVTRLRHLMRSVRILTLDDSFELSEALVLPEKDRPVLVGAVQSGANYLVTGDKKHFGPLFGVSIRGTTIIPPTELLAELRTGLL